LGELGIDGRIILKWILKKENVKVWTDFMWLRIGASGRIFCKHSSELPRSITGREFLD
jgi:hypothetical protein